MEQFDRSCMFPLLDCHAKVACRRGSAPCPWSLAPVILKFTGTAFTTLVPPEPFPSCSEHRRNPDIEISPSARLSVEPTATPYTLALLAVAMVVSLVHQDVMAPVIFTGPPPQLVADQAVCPWTPLTVTLTGTTPMTTPSCPDRATSARPAPAFAPPDICLARRDSKTSTAPAPAPGRRCLR